MTAVTDEIEVEEAAVEGPVAAVLAPDGLFHRSAAAAVGVDFGKRLIELIVTPYETEAAVDMRGRTVTEVFSRGAYDGVERRPNRVKLNRDHDTKRLIGGAVKFWPSRKEGLVAEVRVAETDLGDESLKLAREGWLGVSAGYRPMAGGEKWETRSRVRITRAYLGHIALVPDPAYEDAQVLSMRNADLAVSATPNLDVVRGWRLEERYAALG